MVARSRGSRYGTALQPHGGLSRREKTGVVSKKKTLRADEQDRPDVVRRRMNFAIARRFSTFDRFVFLDESSAKTNMTRLYGRAPVGQRCYFSAPHGHWRTTTLLSAIRCTGVIEDASIVFDGPTDAIVFRSYVEQCLAIVAAGRHRSDGQSGQPQGRRRTRSDRPRQSECLVSPALQPRSESDRENVEQGQNVATPSRRANRRRVDPGHRRSAPCGGRRRMPRLLQKLRIRYT